MIATDKKVSVLGMEVIFFTEEYDFKNPVKAISTDLNFVTISSASAKDVKVEDHAFDKPVTVVSEYIKDKGLKMELPAGTFQEIIWNASIILVEIFKTYATDSGRPLKGFEFLYLKKIKIYKGNILEFRIEKIQN